MDCKYCKKSDQDEDFIYETKLYKVFLAPEQSYLGRCVIISKRHCESLSDLNQKELDDFLELIKKIESTSKKAFGATMFNWTCLMNNSYRKMPYHPHIHWHFRPRYEHKVEFAGVTFEDPDFGNHYDKTRTQNVSIEVKKKIIEKIRAQLK